MKYIFLILFIIVFISGCSSAELLSDGHEATSKHLEEHDEEKVHLHADFKVYIDNNEVDFSVLMYQLRAKSVHVEDSIGEVVHVHEKGITIGDFFKTLDIDMYNNCIIIPIEGSYCNTDKKELRFYVNNIENNEFENYEIKDKDKILVSYGKEEDIKEQLESITLLASED